MIMSYPQSIEHVQSRGRMDRWKLIRFCFLSINSVYMNYLGGVKGGGGFQSKMEFGSFRFD